MVPSRLGARNRRIRHPGYKPLHRNRRPGIVLQQWLHDAWLYLWWKAAGYTGVAVSVAVPAALALLAQTGTVSRLAQNPRYPGRHC